MTPTKPRPGRGRKNQSGKFNEIVADSQRISGEEVHGLLTQVLKDRLFNGVRYVYPFPYILVFFGMRFVWVLYEMGFVVVCECGLVLSSEVMRVV